MPYEEISKETYEKLMENLKPLHIFTGTEEEKLNTGRSQDNDVPLFCDGESCVMQMNNNDKEETSTN